MGFTLSEEGARAKYGEYWQKQTTQAAQQPNIDIAPRKPASFAEPANTPATAQTDAQADTLDAIDILVNEATSQWQALLDPMLAPIEQLLAQAAARGQTAQQVLDNLPQLLQAMDASPLHHSLTQASFVAGMAGSNGIEV